MDMHAEHRALLAEVTAEDVRRLVGDDPAMIAAVLALKPSLAEVEEAVTWKVGDGDVLARSDHPLSGKVAAIYDIVAADRLRPGTGPEGP